MPLDLGNGKSFTDDQVKQALADPTFDPNKFAQQNGMTDMGQIHDKLIQAQQIAGPGGYATGDAALQQQFSRYQQNTPNGRFANDFQGFVGDLNPGAASAMRAGTYSGPANTQSDFAPGGIFGPGSASSGTQGYASGLGANGNGGGWGAAPTGASAQRPTAQIPVAQSSGFPAINNPQNNGMFGFKQTGPNMAMASQFQAQPAQQPQQVSPGQMQSTEQNVLAQPGMNGSPRVMKQADPNAIGNVLGNWAQLGYKPSWAQ